MSVVWEGRRLTPFPPEQASSMALEIFKWIGTAFLPALNELNPVLVNTYWQSTSNKV